MRYMIDDATWCATFAASSSRTLPVGNTPFAVPVPIYSDHEKQWLVGSWNLDVHEGRSNQHHLPHRASCIVFDTDFRFQVQVFYSGEFDGGHALRRHQVGLEELPVLPHCGCGGVLVGDPEHERFENQFLS